MARTKETANVGPLNRKDGRDLQPGEGSSYHEEVEETLEASIVAEDYEGEWPTLLDDEEVEEP